MPGAGLSYRDSRRRRRRCGGCGLSPRLGLYRSVGAWSLWSMAVAASSPLVVLAGGDVAMYASTGVVGVPLSFVVVTGALVPLTVGYVAASRHLGHAASAYALLAHGLGRGVGVAGAAVALVCYSAIGTSLFGLLGVVVVGWLQVGVWWQWALLAWAVVALLGVTRFAPMWGSSRWWWWPSWWWRRR